MLSPVRIASSLRYSRSYKTRRHRAALWDGLTFYRSNRQRCVTSRGRLRFRNRRRRFIADRLGISCGHYRTITGGVCRLVEIWLKVKPKG